MTKTRRRGAELEAEVYAATRQLLNQDGLAQLTFAKVAAAAGTSKPVIYRHWETPFSLALLAIQDKIKADNHGRVDQVVLTGTNLREDLLQVAQRFTASMDAFGQSFMRSWFEGVDQNKSDQVKQLLTDVRQIDLHAIERVVDRAVDRGELCAGTLPEDVQLLLFDWLRYRMFASQPVDESTRITLVDYMVVPAFQRTLGTPDRP